MFFKSLEALRGQIDTLHCSVTFQADGSMHVIVNPQVPEDALKSNPALGTQFAVTATAEELDAKLPAALGTIASTRASMEAQVNAEVASMKAATKPAAKPAAGGGASGPKAKEPTVDPVALSGSVAQGDSTDSAILWD